MFRLVSTETIIKTTVKRDERFDWCVATAVGHAYPQLNPLEALV